MTKKKSIKFQPGDRVRVYGTEFDYNGSKGTVYRVVDSTEMLVEVEGMDGVQNVHPKTCRRLKTK